MSDRRPSKPKPFYDEDGVTIHHGDCREWMPEADVIVSDPPYDDNGRWLVSEINRGAVFGYPELLVEWCVASQRVPSEWVTWWPTTPKPVSGGRKLPASSEAVALFGEVTGGRSVTRPRVDGDRFLQSIHEGRGHNGSARMGDVWTDPAPHVGFNSHRRLHPNQKPMMVMLRLIQLLGDEGVVLDPFMGSGTTLLAAQQLGRKAIGIEVEERYCEVAVDRLAQGVLQLEGGPQ